MKSILFSFVLFGLLLSTASHAQTACPPGMEEYGEGVCGYSQSEQPATHVPEPRLPQLPKPPPQQWATRWGAIAIDSDKGVLGTTTGITDKSAAEQGATADCRAKGGIICKLEISYDNECASLVVSKEGHAATADSTVDKAVQLGMKTCTNAGYHNCHAGYTACSLPVRVK